jgi:two-component system nitrate/nitrite response regulator NarP
MSEVHTVLLVDDHPGIRRALRDYLNRTNALRVVGDIARGADLPWALQTYHPDLIVLDLELERGYTPANAVAHIHTLAPEAKVVIYSAHSDFQIVTHMLDLGVNGYILKTDEMSAVVRSIEETAAGERCFSPGLAPILADGNWRANSLNLAERGVLQMLSDGMSTRQIALEMHIAERTAREYAGKAMRKLRARSWPHAVALAMRKKVIR